MERMKGREGKRAEGLLLKIQDGKLIKCVPRKFDRLGRQAPGC